MVYCQVDFLDSLILNDSPQGPSSKEEGEYRHRTFIFSYLRCDAGCSKKMDEFFFLPLSFDRGLNTKILSIVGKNHTSQSKVLDHLGRTMLGQYE